MTPAETPTQAKPLRHVRIGEIRVASSGILKITLGSCVAIALINKRAGICGLAHCFIPIAPEGCQSTDARYTDRAALNLLRRVGPDPTPRSHLRAFLAGGNKMRGNKPNSRMQVGKLNIDIARASLKELRIRFTELELGGTEGTSAILDCDTCTFTCGKINRQSIDRNEAEKETPWN
jgi:chemotaxis protein CheD